MALYLCIVLDLYDQRIAGWSIYHRQDRQMVIRAVQMAVWQQPKDAAKTRQAGSEGCSSFGTVHDIGVEPILVVVRVGTSTGEPSLPEGFAACKLAVVRTADTAQVPAIAQHCQWDA